MPAQSIEDGPRTVCLCPRCLHNHTIRMRWIGRGTPRKFCQKCKLDMGRDTELRFAPEEHTVAVRSKRRPMTVRDFSETGTHPSEWRIMPSAGGFKK